MGFNAYQKYLGQEGQITRLNQLSPDDANESIRLRNFIRTGEDYVLIAMSLDQQAHIAGQSDFDNYKSANSVLISEFESLFYGTRSDMAGQRPDAWIELNPLYPGMENFLKGYTEMSRLYIISSKRSEYIRKICDAYGLSIPHDHIFYAGMERSKREIIEELIGENRIAPEQFHFVEDQVDHLLKVQPAGIRGYLAQWGYNNAEQQERAKNASIPVLAISEFYNRFS